MLPQNSPTAALLIIVCDRGRHKTATCRFVGIASARNALGLQIAAFSGRLWDFRERLDGADEIIMQQESKRTLFSFVMTTDTAKSRPSKVKVPK